MNTLTLARAVEVHHAKRTVLLPSGRSVRAVPCECGDGSCMLCDDDGFRAADISYRIEWLDCTEAPETFNSMESAADSIGAELADSPVRSRYTWDESGIIRDEEGDRRARIVEVE